jgi:hypothetical protein
MKHLLDASREMKRLLDANRDVKRLARKIEQAALNADQAALKAEQAVHEGGFYRRFPISLAASFSLPHREM